MAAPDVAQLPTAADVDAAAARLSGVALHTPLISSPVLDALTGGRIFLKLETLQRTGSFKFRGAFNRLSMLPAERRRGGVVAFSSGNHAQGVAAAAKLFGMPAVIVMPVGRAARQDRERTAAHGAEVVLYDRQREDRSAIARGIAGDQDQEKCCNCCNAAYPDHMKPASACDLTKLAFRVRSLTTSICPAGDRRTEQKLGFSGSQRSCLAGESQSRAAALTKNIPAETRVGATFPRTPDAQLYHYCNGLFTEGTESAELSR